MAGKDSAVLLYRLLWSIRYLQLIVSVHSLRCLLPVQFSLVLGKVSEEFADLVSLEVVHEKPDMQEFALDDLEVLLD